MIEIFETCQTKSIAKQTNMDESLIIRSIPATHLFKVRYTCTLYSEGSICVKKNFFFYPKGLEVFCVDFLIKDASTDMYMKTFNAYVLTSTSTSTFCFIHSLSLLKYVLVIPNIDIL